MNKILFLVITFTLTSLTLSAQNRGLTNTSKSKYAQMVSTDIDAVKWTDGFWSERFGVFKDSMILSMWKTLNNPDISHAYRNIEIAAGVCPGEHWGPPFHDGDFYKWLEAVASVYAVTKDPKLDKLMDGIIANIVKAQREDGYIHTPVIIMEKNKGVDSHKMQTVIGTAVGEEGKGAFDNRLNFEN